jgi:translation initiation factor IF-2
MYNERNQIIKEAGPSVPVLILGLNSAPQAGDTFKVFKEEREAKQIVNKRVQLVREQGCVHKNTLRLTKLAVVFAIGDFKELNVIVKGDVDGSVEALSDSLLRLTTSEVQVNIIHKSVGQVIESDVFIGIGIQCHYHCIPSSSISEPGKLPNRNKSTFASIPSSMMPSTS